VWLCTPASLDTTRTSDTATSDTATPNPGPVPGASQRRAPGVPLWATRVIEGLSAPGDQVIVRGVGAGRSGYPGQVEDIRALVEAARGAGRQALGLIPGTDSAGPIISTGATAAGVEVWGSGRSGAALVVVVAGPVRAGARALPEGPTAGQMTRWARMLRPGGLMAVLCPPVVGRSAVRRASRAARLLQEVRDNLTGGLWGGPLGSGLGDGLAGGRVFGGGDVVRLGQQAGLIYTQHIVLVHAPTRPDGTLDAPPRGQSGPRTHAPCAGVHTDLWLLAAAGSPTTADTADTTGTPASETVARVVPITRPPRRAAPPTTPDRPAQSAADSSGSFDAQEIA
jgi:hypothetical protein